MPSPTPQTALLLAAGLGQRLAPLTEVRAKPAVPLAGEAIVRRILRGLRAQGVRDVVLNLHHRPETIAAVVGDGSDLGVRARYSWEQPRILGGAGGPRRALPILGADCFFIVNGDTLADVPLDRLAAAHMRSGALVTLALTANDDPMRYGGVRITQDGVVIGFTRRGPDATDSCHFVGVQIVQREAFEALDPDMPVASIGGAYDALMRERPGSIRGVVFDASTFWDIGTVEDYWRTSRVWSQGTPNGWLGEASSVDQTARVTRSIVWDRVHVPAGCVLDECIVTDGVQLPARATHRRSILMTDAHGGVRVEPFGFDPS
jgi:NDP-sugar pyrophosphorylase family protein